MALFYVNYSLLMPFLLFKQKFYLYTLFLFFLAAINYCWHSTIWNHFDFHYFFSPASIHVMPLLYWQIYVLFSSIGINLWERWAKSEKLRYSLEGESKISELQYLKSQMSPHFLFNTLNNIYGLSIKGSTKTVKAISQLKSLMKYIDFFEKGENIDIQKECEYLKNYVCLNQLRYDVDVQFESSISNNNRLIEPMLLLPFIENAFKHGDTSQNGLISIRLNEANKRLNFSIENKHSKTKKKDQASGVGIKNVQKRIGMIYPKNSKIEIMDSIEFYRVNVNFNLK